MVWWLWMLGGAALAALTLITYVYVMNTIDARARARRQAVQWEQTRAEQHMQRVVQDTIQRMFNAARGLR